MQSGRAGWRRLYLSAMVALMSFGVLSPAGADDEASNFSHVVAGPYGRCYAKSVPAHLYDPEGAPRQEGRTEIYHVTDSEDVLLQSYDWFAQRLFVLCGPERAILVRIGPWQRGHDPRSDHLAIAFYEGGELIRRYSTLEIAGDEKAEAGAISRYKNVSASVSHYSVFESGPELVKITHEEGGIFREEWRVEATTIDGRRLVFDPATGLLR